MDVNRGKKPGTTGPSFMVYLNYFRRIPSFYKFKYDHSDAIWVDVDTIICIVTMSFDAEKDCFELDHEDASLLNDFFLKAKKK